MAGSGVVGVPGGRDWQRLLLGVLAYPFLLLLGWWYARAAERLEQVFADHIQS